MLEPHEELKRHRATSWRAFLTATRGRASSALKIVQRHRGWVSRRDAARACADALDMTPTELDDVATFYNLIFRKPVGRHVILVCDSVSCWIMGYEPSSTSFDERLGIDLGETTRRRPLHAAADSCLGTCDHAPGDDDRRRPAPGPRRPRQPRAHPGDDTR